MGSMKKIVNVVRAAGPEKRIRYAVLFSVASIVAVNTYTIFCPSAW